MCSSTVRTLRHVVIAWFCLFATAFGGTLMLGTLVLAGADVAFRHFRALAEVVVAAALHAHAAFSSSPESFCFVAPAAKR
jgi:uncharacterized membrane protein YczE